MAEQGADVRGPRSEIFIDVWMLDRLLNDLEDHDQLSANADGNLSIFRRGQYIGFVNLLEDKIEFLSWQFLQDKIWQGKK